MGCLGTLFALEENKVIALKSESDDRARLSYVQEVIESTFYVSHENWLVELDKAWDAIHRTLTDGKLGWHNGSFPFSHAILGGEKFYQLDDYIVTLKTPAEVKEIAKTLLAVEEHRFKQNYFQIDAADYGMPTTDEDYEYTWAYFGEMREFYRRAAEAGRFVLFTAS